MRCILDTNVLVSHALLPDPVPRHYDAVRRCVETARGGVLLFSAATLEELRAVLRRPAFDRHRGRAEREAWLAGIEGAATLVEPAAVAPLCRDPGDDKFLALADAGRADLLVTEDRDLLVLGRVGGTRILRPAAFVAALPAVAAVADAPAAPPESHPPIAHPVVHPPAPG